MKRRLKIRKPLTRRETCDIFAKQFRPPFRGEIWEFFADTPMGRGFSNQGQPFDIETACYLKEPMRELRIRPYGLFSIQAAVQMLKTNAMIEQAAGYFLANDPGDMSIFLTGDESAFDIAKARLMPYLKSQKDIAQIIDAVQTSSSTGRHDITTDEFYLPDMILRVWPLNLPSTQSNTLRYVFISDAFLSGCTGMIEQAIKRTTQHNSIRVRDYKIIIESQGGEVKDDFDAVHTSTDQRRLNVRCQFCDSLQEFVWHKKRPDDFMPVPPKDIPSLDHVAWIEHNRPILLSEERRHAGMKRGDGAVKRSDGSYDADEVRKQTHYECFHCGSAWHDTPRERQAIDASSTYIPSNPTAPPEKVGFWWPAWCGQRLSWGNIMLDYLEVKQAAAQGNVERFRQWTQKVEARAWSMEILQPESSMPVGSYDPNQVMENELCRIMAVDVQQEQDHYDRTGKSIPGWFWYEACVVDKFGNGRELARGHAKTWEAWMEVQKQWKIPNDYVTVDIGHWPGEVMARAAAEREEIQVQHAIPWERFKTKTWLMLAGDELRTFGKHQDGKYRPYAPPQRMSVPIIDASGHRRTITLTKVRWSNLAFKLQLDAILSCAPGMPRYEILSCDRLDAHTQEMERGMLAYEMQMKAEVYEEVRGKQTYHPVAASRPSHYRDCRMMIMVKMAMLGLIGHQAVEASVPAQ